MSSNINTNDLIASTAALLAAASASANLNAQSIASMPSETLLQLMLPLLQQQQLPQQPAPTTTTSIADDADAPLAKKAKLDPAMVGPPQCEPTDLSSLSSRSSPNENLQNLVKHDDSHETSPVSPPQSFLSTYKYARTHRCTDCTFETREPRDFLHHRRDVHGVKINVYYCSMCAYASQQAAKVVRHEQLIHATVRPRSVNLKPQQTVRSSLHPRSKVRPMIGKKKPIGSKVTLSHNAVKSGQLFECDQCQYKTDNTTRFRKHLRCHRTSHQTSCDQCDFKTAYSWNVDRHVRAHNTPGKYTCNRCSFSHNTRQAITFHISHHHKSTSKDENETQTDVDKNDQVPDNVQVAAESYIFEQHGVRVDSDTPVVNETSSNSTAQIKPKLSLIPESQSIDDPEALPIEQTIDNQSISTDPDHRSPSSSPSPDSNIEKRFLSESEAILSPHDQLDGDDPTITTDADGRTCLICGYRGKWISEMVRHKRVHESDRPFRCRYCSRSSKWKADLIRHLLKVHGIRVLSKYSRSKTFETDAKALRQLKRAHGIAHVRTNSTSPPQATETSQTSVARDFTVPRVKISATTPKPSNNNNYTCAKCGFQNQESSVLVDHLVAVHNTQSHECMKCGFASADKTTVMCHLLNAHKGDLTLLASNVLIGPMATPTVINQPISVENEQHVDNKSETKCDQCPFEAASNNELETHKKGHKPPVGLINYKCPFCAWNSKKKPLIFEHLKLHTNNPEEHMATVQSDIVSNVMPASPSKNALSGLSLEPKSSQSALPTPDSHIDDWSTATTPTTTSLLKCQDEHHQEMIHAGRDPTLVGFVFTKNVPMEIPRVASPSQHGDRSTWKCRYCEHVSKRRSHVRAHEKNHFRKLPNDEYKCPRCMFRGQPQQLNDHYIAEHACHLTPSAESQPDAVPSSEYNVLYCDLCPAVFDEPGYFDEHIMNHPVEPVPNGYECSKCNYTVMKPQWLELHDRVHQTRHYFADAEDTPPVTTFPDVSSAGLRLDGTPRRRAGAVICPKCPATFTSSSQYRRHARCHGASYANVCPLCDYSVQLPINLMKHISTHHGIQVDRMADIEKVVPKTEL